MPAQRIFLPFLFIISAVTSHAQEFTLTTSAANIISAKALIDLPGLTGNPDAIIVATPLGNTKTANPHPIGAWYYSGKWNIFNSDFAPLVAGLTYRIQYFQTPGANQFLHMVTQANLGSEGTYIDHPLLNNKPTAQFFFLQNHSPDIRQGSWLNKFEEKAGYSTAAGKWFITNIGGQPMQKASAYNIVIYTGTGLPPNPGEGTCNCPASLPPNGNAGGDLAGAYPNPTVQNLLGRPLSVTSPNVGDVLKWDGTTWVPSEDITGNAGTGSSNKQLVLIFNQTSSVVMHDPNVKSTTIPGLENKTFTVTQKSHVVFNTVLTVYNQFVGSTVFETRPVEVWIVVDILNASNQEIVVGVGNLIVNDNRISTIRATGAGILPAGTYHTRVRLNRQEQGAPMSIEVASLAGDRGKMRQGGQMIIQIIPD